MWGSFIIVGLVDNNHNSPYLWIPFVIYTAYLLYTIVRYMATKLTIQNAKEDIEAIEQMSIA